MLRDGQVAKAAPGLSRVPCSGLPLLSQYFAQLETSEATSVMHDTGGLGQEGEVAEDNVHAPHPSPWHL